MKNRSKRVLIFFPRTNKLTKDQIADQAATVAQMAMLSIGGTISPTSELTFKLRDEPGSVGLPRGWFSGDSQFASENKRVMSKEGYRTLYQWCKREGVPAWSGEIDGEESLMVIGPYWEDIIDELLARAVPLDRDIRSYSGAQKSDK